MGKKHASQYANFGWLRKSQLFEEDKKVKIAVSYITKLLN